MRGSSRLLMTGPVDFSASLLGYTERFWFGFAVDHLLQPNYGLYNNEVKWPIKYSVFGGYQIVKNQEKAITPSGKETSNEKYAVVDFTLDPEGLLVRGGRLVLSREFKELILLGGQKTTDFQQPGRQFFHWNIEKTLGNRVRILGGFHNRGLLEFGG